jgi:hypothetical protein
MRALPPDPHAGPNPAWGIVVSLRRLIDPAGRAERLLNIFASDNLCQFRQSIQDSVFFIPMHA